METIIVEVSQDNVSYCGFSPDYTFSPETTYIAQIPHWKRFAELHPLSTTLRNEYFSGNDLYDTTKTSGDGFDLDNLSATNDYNIGCNTTLEIKLNRKDLFTYD